MTRHILLTSTSPDAGGGALWNALAAFQGYYFISGFGAFSSGAVEFCVMCTAGYITFCEYAKLTNGQFGWSEAEPYIRCYVLGRALVSNQFPAPSAGVLDGGGNSYYTCYLFTRAIIKVGVNLMSLCFF